MAISAEHCSQECSKMNCHSGSLSPTPCIPLLNSPNKPLLVTEGKCFFQGLPLTSEEDMDKKFCKKDPPNTSSEDHLETKLPCIPYTNCDDKKEEKCFSGNNSEAVSNKPPSLMNRQLIPCNNDTTTEKRQNSTVTEDKSHSRYIAQCLDEKISNGKRLSQYKYKIPSDPDREIAAMQRPSLLEEAIFSLTCPPSIMFSVRDSVTEGRYILRDVDLLPYTGYGFPCSREHTTSWQPPVKTKPCTMKANFQTMKKYGLISTRNKEIAETVLLLTEETSFTGTKQPAHNTLMYPNRPTDSPNMHPWYRQWKITFNSKRQIIIGERRLFTHGICVIATLHQLLQVLSKSSSLTSYCVTLPLEVVHYTHDVVDGTTMMDRDDQSQESDSNSENANESNSNPGGDGDQHDECNSDTTAAAAAGGGGSGAGGSGGNDNNGDRDSDNNNGSDIDDDDQDDDEEENDDILNHPKEVESACNEPDSIESIVAVGTTVDDDFFNSACVKFPKTVFTEKDLKTAPKGKLIQPYEDTIVLPNHDIGRKQASMVTGAIPGTKMAECCCSSIQQVSRGQPTIPGILFTNSQHYSRENSIHSQQPEVLTSREEQGIEQFHVVGPVLQEQSSEEVIVVQMDGFLQQNCLVPTQEPQQANSEQSSAQTYEQLRFDGPVEEEESEEI